MNMMNSLIIEGEVVKKPTIQAMPNGATVCTIQIAVTREYKNADGERSTEVSYFDVDAFGNLADICEKMCLKGYVLRVVGRLKNVRWEAEGKSHSKVKVIADHVEFKPVKKGVKNEEGKLGIRDVQ